MRYRGQSYEVVVAVSDIATRDDLRVLGERFHEAHLRRYGHKATSEAIEIVNYKVTGVGEIPKPEVNTHPLGPGDPPPPMERRAAWFGKAGRLETPVFRRADLRAGMRLAGPAIVEEKTSTVVVYPGQSGRVDEFLNIEIDAGVPA
jgi:N-methylhydantoinase A